MLEKPFLKQIPKLKSIEHAENYLKPGTTFEMLDKVAL